MEDQSRSRVSNPWVRRVLLALVGLGALYAVVLFLLSRFLDPQEMASRLEPRLEAATSREVEIGSAKLSFFPLGMRLTDVVVSDPTGLAPALARVESMEFQVAFFPLFRKEVQVRRLVVESPEAHLVIGAGESNNFGDFSADSQEEPPPAGEVQSSELPFSLALDAVRVSQGRIRFSDLRDSTEISVEGLTVEAAVTLTESGAWTFVGDSEARLSLAKGAGGAGLGGVPLAVTFDLSADPDFQELEIRSGSLGTEGASLDMSGTVQGLKDPIRSLDLVLAGDAIPLSRLVGALPDSLRNRAPDTEGSLSADLRVEGELGAGFTPQVTGTIQFKEVNLRTRAGVRLARHLSSELTLSPGWVLDIQARGEAMDGPFTLAGRAEVGGESPVDLQVDVYPDLALAQSLIELPEGTSMEGRLKVEGRLTGAARRPRDLRFWGEASPTEIRFTTPKLGVPVALPGGRITLQGNQASFKDLPLVLGEDALTFSGEASGLTGFGLPGRTLGLHGSLRGARLDLVKLSPNPPPDPDLTYGKVVFARLGNRQVAGGSVEEAAGTLRLQRPNSLPLAGELMVALDTVIDAKGRMEGVEATVAFGPDFVRISPASFRRYGGQLHASLNLALGEEGPEPFSMQVSVTDLEAGAFLGATSPLGKYVRGRLSLTMDIAGSLDDLLLPDRSSLVGSGSFQLADGGLSANRVTESLADFLGLEELRSPSFQEWATGFILENGMVRLAEATLHRAPGDPRVGGSVGLAGELDLLSAFTLPSDRLSRFARENLGIAGEVAGRVANRPEVVQAVIRIGGSIVSPNLRADPEATAQALWGAIQEEVTTEAQTRIREQTEQLQNRATGFLRDLARGQEEPPPPPATDTISPDSVPGDSIRPDSLRPDTTAVDSLRPDTTAADSLRPDTMAADSLRPDTLKPDTVPPDTSRASSPRPRARPSLPPEALFPGLLPFRDPGQPMERGRIPVSGAAGYRHG